MNHKFAPIFLCLFSLFVIAPFLLEAQQKKQVTLEDIFKHSTFSQKSVYGINWMQDGQFYTSLESNARNGADYVLKYDIQSGTVVDTLVDGNQLIPENESIPLRIDDYSFNTTEDKLLLATEKESIYRRSYQAYYYVYDVRTKELQELAQGDKQAYATFSPDGSKVAFVRNNNLYYVDLATMNEHAITTNGKWNQIINGSSDWVYEEEFTITKAFFWSPDGSKIAYYTFDESEVKEYNMQVWAGLYPADYKFKYPKAGEKNSAIAITVFHLDNKKPVKIDLGDEEDIYIPRLNWTKNNTTLSIIRMNRLQNKLEILHANPDSGETKTILTENSETYVDINYTDDLIYLNDNEHFIRTSEQDGFKHIYLHRLNGDLVRQITSGEWEVDQFLGVDEKKNIVYYISTEDSPLERHLYSIKTSGKSKKRLTSNSGVNNSNFSRDFTYYINYHSSNATPLTVSLHTAPSGKQIKILEDNRRLKQTVADHTWSKKDFFSIDIENGLSLNAYMIKPPHFDETKKYPVLMYVYGGPGSQEVLNNWGGNRELWFQFLAQQGYIVACVDNRGTGGKGKDFKHSTYAQLGKFETEDQIESAKYLAGLPYVDPKRIGIWGWSYGGYMSSLALFLGNEHFKAAIAVAPVTNWRFYDTIYTERYLKTPQQNPEGYDEYSPLSHVEKLKGKYLLVHGTGDDNVHFQNSVELVNGLVNANKQFDTFYYPNRNHGIYGGNTSFHLYQMMTEFVLQNL